MVKVLFKVVVIARFIVVIKFLPIVEFAVWYLGKLSR